MNGLLADRSMGLRRDEGQAERALLPFDLQTATTSGNLAPSFHSSSSGMQAATLRRRTAKLDKSQAKLAASLDPSIPPPPRRSSSHLMSARLRLISTAVVILVVFVALKAQGSSSRTQKFSDEEGEWVVGKLEESYAICSARGESKAIWTVDQEGDETVECLVVEGKEVLETGSLAHVRSKYGDLDTLGPPSSPSAQVPLSASKSGIKIHFLPPSSAITPGLIDSHGHILEYGHWKSSVGLVGASSSQDVVERLKCFVLKQGCSHHDKAWVEGMGWDQNVWEVKEFPTAADLEAEPTLAGLPIALTRIDGHALWVSEAILKLMSPLPSSIPGGEIVRDSNGRPTGVFVDNAMNLVEAVRPSRTEEQTLGFLKKTMREGLKRGLVGVHDAGVPPEDVAFFQKVAASSSLPLRIYAMIACPDRSIYCGAKQAQIPWEKYDGRLVLRSVKLVADGALGSWGAAMLEPYSDRSDGWKGIMLAPEERFPPLIADWVNAGWQVNVHAIGDRANHAVLDGFAASPEAVRPRLEHAQILTPDDLQRVVDLGVIASYQPTHATSDMNYAETKIGSDRIKTAYAWQSVLQKGGRIALGSDFPIESADPLKGFYAAVTRLDESGNSPHGKGGWYPSERFTRAQTLKGMTLDAAYASFSENITGSLVPGKRADYVVWDRDINTVSPDQILQAKVLLTVIDGQPVFGSLW